MHNEELHYSYSSRKIIGKVKSRSMKLAGNLERMREKRRTQGSGGKVRKEDAIRET
jgi:hypothetical protein